jgi:beta-glucosidase
MPNIQLVAFDRIHVPKGIVVKVKLSIEPRYLAVWTDNKGFVIETG